MHNGTPDRRQGSVGDRNPHRAITSQKSTNTRHRHPPSSSSTISTHTKRLPSFDPSITRLPTHTPSLHLPLSYPHSKLTSDPPGTVHLAATPTPTGTSTMTESRLPRSTSLAATRGTKSVKSGLAALAGGKIPVPAAQTTTPAPSQVSQSTRSTRAKAQGKHRPTASTASAALSTTSTTTAGRSLRPSHSSGTIAPSASSQNVALNNAKRIVAQSSTIRRTVSPRCVALHSQLTAELGHAADTDAAETTNAEPQATVGLCVDGRSSHGRDAIVECRFAIGEQARAADRGAWLNSSYVARSRSGLLSPTPANGSDSTKASPKVSRPSPPRARHLRTTSMVTSTPKRVRRRGVPDTPALSTLLSGDASALAGLDVSLASDTSFNHLTPPRPPKLSASTTGSSRSVSNPNPPSKLVRSDSSPALSLGKGHSQFAQELGRLRAQRSELEERLAGMRAEEARLQALIERTMAERQAALDATAEMEQAKNQAIWNGIISACEEAIESEQDFKATLDALRVLVMA
ncbi:hypothetical protein A1Q1_04561 [Trichosporon asahii var. asahii CBS 2479]|uniref:Uncharacterized protein n=1 Tax=Trichosporon asahii var. asahii (strain ATCC 90039 / CBS 2479 / JCM 2466 / KCTC 7840 / NBRC 103889/ NCYC 2677 / UAMH 7654) TaxID=1186058 RepID=J4UKF0_TRIAS|nr:hypothetical protein A1Q1_04561 [Trichosporon asahii var. asahii CBS 2479]EJT52350.1 hypothetical protein A1Q1_04561 [Trichosporon asahii var. asahii CBS 2479]